MGDRAHLSTKRNAPSTVSAHAWFEAYNDYCPKDLRADVTAQMQVTNEQGTYRNVGDVAYQLDALIGGKGERNRANPRVTCATGDAQFWRMDIDIDIIGYQDPADHDFSFARPVKCDV